MLGLESLVLTILNSFESTAQYVNADRESMFLDVGFWACFALTKFIVGEK